MFLWACKRVSVNPYAREWEWARMCVSASLSVCLTMHVCMHAWMCAGVYYECISTECVCVGVFVSVSKQYITNICINKGISVGCRNIYSLESKQLFSQYGMLNDLFIALLQNSYGLLECFEFTLHQCIFIKMSNRPLKTIALDRKRSHLTYNTVVLYSYSRLNSRLTPYPLARHRYSAFFYSIRKAYYGPHHRVKPVDTKSMF